MHTFGKILKIILIVVLVLAAILVLGLWLLSRIPSAPRDYPSSVKTGGVLEKQYLALGPDSIRFFEEKAEDPYKKFSVYYPQTLEESEKTFPAVLVLNGTGILPEKYDTFFKHMASWGFVVIGDDNPSTGTGNSASAQFEELEKLNSDPQSVLYQKINLDDIGLIGHSQGGAGVLTAATNSPYKDHFKAIVALSPTHIEFAHQLGWMYEMDQIQAPTLMLAGTEGEFETESVIPISSMKKMYENLSVPKAMARRIGADHGHMLYSADGVATAWLLRHLQGNEEAAKEFNGEAPELKNNSLYQDVAIDLDKN